MHAMASGEPYYYRCWAGLLFATIPVAAQNKCCGGLTLGGFHAADEAHDIAETVTQHLHAWPSTDLEAFLSRLDSLRPITPSALRGLGSLVMETTFSSGLNSSPFFHAQNEKYLQQRKIAEAFEDMRQQSLPPPDALGDTFQFVSYLHRNDRTNAMEFMSKYLARLLMASNWDLAKLKAHLRVLLAVMTSEDILRGTPWTTATSHEIFYMTRLEKARSTEESCYEVAEMIQQYFAGQDRHPLPQQTMVERLLDWLQRHYSEEATLAVASKAVGASVSSVVHSLRRHTGKTYKQLLQEIRIAEARKMLATTRLEVSEIADRCGFFDQSHFTKALKKAINLTPGQFRKLLSIPEEEVLK